MGKPTGFEDEIVALLTELPLIHERAIRAGLIRTGHKLHEAVKEIGWEVATLRSGEGQESGCRNPDCYNGQVSRGDHVVMGGEPVEVVTPCPDCSPASEEGR